MTIFLLSPTEAALAELFKERVIISSLPEEKGADVLVYTRPGLAGIQRKEFPHDFLSSFTDGRMTRELALLQNSCRFPILIREGRPRYYPDSRIVVDRKQPSRFTRKQLFGMMNDIMFIRGIFVVDTDNTEQTVEFIKSLADFLNKEKHLGLYTRPSAQGLWYVPTARDIELWVLQSFPGIGPTLADNIVTYFGGRIPLKWSCSLEELEQVPGLGKKRARVLIESLPSGEQGIKDVFERMRSRLKK